MLNAGDAYPVGARLYESVFEVHRSFVTWWVPSDLPAIRSRDFKAKMVSSLSIHPPICVFDCLHRDMTMFMCAHVSYLNLHY